jgi:hypothetical protein
MDNLGELFGFQICNQCKLSMNECDDGLAMGGMAVWMQEAVWKESKMTVELDEGKRLLMLKYIAIFSHCSHTTPWSHCLHALSADTLRDL